jgi:hypothetical protein
MAEPLSRSRTVSLVKSVAEEIAGDAGIVLTRPARRQLVRRSRYYFSQGGLTAVTRAEVAEQIATLLSLAVAHLTGREPVPTIAPTDAAAVRANGVQVRATDVKAAIRRTTCHYLWFC